MNGIAEYAVALGYLGEISISPAVITTWGILLALCVFAVILRSRLKVHEPGAVQSVVELAFQTLESLIRDIVRSDPAPYFPLASALFIFIFAANITGMIPALASPTADISVTSALAVIVFLSVPFFGIRARGLRGYLSQYVKPNPVVLPFMLLGELTRTLALAVRLFGNIMSGQFLLMVIVGVLAGVLKGAALVFLPIGFGLTLFVSLLGLISAVIQPMIFTVLALVYIGAAVERRAIPQPEAASSEGEPDGR